MGIGERLGGGDDVLPWCLEDAEGINKDTRLMVNQLLTPALPMRFVLVLSQASLGLEHRSLRRAGAPAARFH